VTAPPRAPGAIRSSGGGGASTLRRALAVSPETTTGLGLTLALAGVTALGRVVVPLAVQQTVDEGLLAEGGVDTARVALTTAGAALVVLLTGLLSYRVTVRVFRATEAGLATLRARAFDHVHRLAVLTQNGERRGALVSRVTSDVDTVSTFLQTGGIVLLLSLGQLGVAVTLMLLLSWQLGLLVLVCYLPLVLAMRPLQRRAARRYAGVRERYGDVLAAVSESVVGAETIRAHAASERTWRRVDGAVQAHRRAAVRAQVATATTSALGLATTGLVLVAVVVGGTLLGLDGGITLGRLLAFVFIVNLVTQPFLALTEVLNELQNALAGWRRVLGVLDTPVSVADPGDDGVDLPPGPVAVDVQGATFRYPGLDDAGRPRPPVLRGVDLRVAAGARVAVVGETGSGKTTLTRLVTRLVDPDEGRVLLSGVDARRLREASLHRRVVVVPQEGFLFDTTVGENVRFGREGASTADARRALDELGLGEWVDSLPAGVDTEVGQLGERLSAGERQLVALARAHLAGPDLLVLDEATSSVDPATEVRLQRALAGLLEGRTSVAIAHRLSTAEAADVVVVVDDGRVVEVGPSSELARAGGPYARLHDAWTAQHR
jgi:ABC-type multidrug transport system fused ATPase/permease subunit